VNTFVKVKEEEAAAASANPYGASPTKIQTQESED
jgi:hypothetical protein